MRVALLVVFEVRGDGGRLLVGGGLRWKEPKDSPAPPSANDSNRCLT
jgi:hypothetical protein